MPPFLREVVERSETGGFLQEETPSPLSAGFPLQKGDLIDL